MIHRLVFERDRLPVERTASATGPTVPLSSAAAEQLWAINREKRGFCSRDYSGALLLEQYCGVVPVPGGSIEILPKLVKDHDESSHAVARKALLGLLAHAPELNLFEQGAIGQADCRAPLLDLFVLAFLREASRQAMLGLIEGAVSVEASLTSVRGRFLPNENLRLNALRPDLFHCRYDELTVDNALNQYVLCAIEQCRRMITSPATNRAWVETRARYGRVTPTRLSVKDSPSGRLSRSTRRYRRVLGWADRILSSSSPTLTAGAAAAPGLLFDMQKLFEHAVYHRCAREAGPNSSVMRPTIDLPLVSHEQSGGHFGLRPDVLILARPSNDVTRIVDAKWKWVDTQAGNWGISKADVHQVTTYAMRHGCADVCLMYPVPDAGAGERSRTFTVIQPATGAAHRQQITITARTISVFS